MVDKVGSVSSYELGELITDSKTGLNKISQKLSNFDAGSIVKKFYEADMLEVKPIDDAVKLNAELKDELGKFKKVYFDRLTAVEDLRNYFGADPSEVSKNVFAQKSAYGINSSGLPIGQFADITPTSDDTIRDFTLKISQLAKVDQIKSDSAQPFTDPTAALNLGVSSITVNGVAISFDPALNIKDLVSYLNQYTSQTKAIFEYVVTNTTTNEFRVSVTGTELAKPITIDSSARTELKLPALATDSETLVAKFTFNGIDVKRNTNIFKDLIPGSTMNFELRQTTNNEEINVKIQNNYSGVLEKLDKYVGSHNDLVEEVERLEELLVEKRKEIPANKEQHFKVIGLIENYLDNARTQLDKFSSMRVSGAHPAFSSLGSIGVVLDTEGKLSVNSSMLNKALSDQVEYIGTTSNSTFTTTYIPQKSDTAKNLLNQSVAVTVSKDGSGILSAKFTYAGNDYQADISNYRVGGGSSTMFAGFQLLVDKISLDSLSNGASLTANLTIEESTVSHFQDIVKLFGGVGSSANKNFKVYSIPTNMTDDMKGSPVSLIYSKDGSGGISATFNYQNQNYTATVNGYGIFAPDSTPLTGWNLIIDKATADALSNNSSVSTILIGTTGVAYQETKYIESETRESDKIDLKGGFEKLLYQIDDLTTSLQSESEKLTQRAEDKKAIMEREFLDVQKALAVAEEMKMMTNSFIDAISGNW